MKMKSNIKAIFLAAKAVRAARLVMRLIQIATGILTALFALQIFKKLKKKV